MTDRDPVAVLREHYDALEACRPGNLPGGLSGPSRERRKRYEAARAAVPAALAELERRQGREKRLEALVKWLAETAVPRLKSNTFAVSRELVEAARRELSGE